MRFTFRNSQLYTWIWMFVACTVLMAGCGDGGENLPTVYPASGTVTYNGKPLAGATVVFRSTSSSKGKLATGISNAEGHFKLSTYGENDGALPGQHSVTVSKMASVADGGELSMEAAASKEDEEIEAKSEIPEKYSDPQTSGLQETVKEQGSNEFKIELAD